MIFLFFYIYIFFFFNDTATTEIYTLSLHDALPISRLVDLNRNSSQGRRFLGGPGTPYYAGPKAFSEPETRAIRSLILRVRPAVTIWYHQPFGLVDRPETGNDAIARAYSRISGLRFSPLTPRPGSMSRWENVRVRPGSSIVVELPPGTLSAADAQRHAAAVLGLAAGATP